MDDHLFFENAYFIIGTSYAGKSTMVKELAKNKAVLPAKRIIMITIPENLTPGSSPA